MNRQEQAVFLLNTFREEVETHVVSLTRLLVELEEGQADTETVREAMRVLHTVKGAARMMSFLDITRVAHAMENIVGAGGTPDRETTNLLFEGLDTISALAKTATARAMAEAATADPADGTNPMAWLPSGPPSDTVEALVARMEMQGPGALAVVDAPPAPESNRNEAGAEADSTIRVRLGVLDRLLELAGEMMIARQQFDEHVAQIAALREVAETQRREIEALNGLLSAHEAAQMALPLEIVFGTAAVERLHLRLNDVQRGNLGATNLAAADADLAQNALTSAIESFQYTLAELAPLNRNDDSVESRHARAHARALAGQLQQAFVNRQSDGSPRSTESATLDWRTVDEARQTVAALEQRDRALLRGFDVLLRERRAFAVRFAAQAGELQRQTLAVRTQPLEGLFALYPRAVRDIAAERGKLVRLVMSGGAIELDRRVLEAINDPLIHLIRNAIDHGIETPGERAAAGKAPEGTIQLSAEQRGDRVIIAVYDDGAGIDAAKVVAAAVARGLVAPGAAALPRDAAFDLIFRPGLSTRTEVDELSGRGVGMDIVQQRVRQLNGRVSVSSETGLGTRVTMEVPLSLATLPALLVQADDQVYALPAGLIGGTRRFGRRDLVIQSGQPALLLGDGLVPVVWLAQVIGLTPVPREAATSDAPLYDAPDDMDGARLRAARRAAEGHELTAVLLGEGERRLCVVVDAVLDEREVIVRSLGAFVARTPFVAGATILGGGRVALILDVNDLAQAARRAALNGTPVPMPDERRARARRHRRLLVVDDSLATRELERTILESAGYVVETAADGADALRLVRATIGTDRPGYDLVVSDIEMPHMDGFAFTAALRRQPESTLRQLPIVIVTSRESPEDRRRGLEAGAQAYIVKNQFDQNRLLETIRRLTDG